MLGGENVPKFFDKWRDLKYNKLKQCYRYENQSCLQSRLDYILPNGEKNFISNKSIITHSRTIAGAGSKTAIRVEQKLVHMHGGNIGEWKKRVGKIES